MSFARHALPNPRIAGRRIFAEIQNSLPDEKPSRAVVTRLLILSGLAIATIFFVLDNITINVGRSVDLQAAGQVAFFTPGIDGFEIFVIDADRGITQQITQNELVHDLNPVWSPDGTRIVYQSDEIGISELYVMDVQSGAVRRVGPPHPGLQVSWSPDSSQLVFTARVGNDDEVFVVNADGEDLRQLTDNDFADSFPVWSPDGNRIAFMSFADNQLDLYTMNTDGSDVRRITNDRAQDLNPVWSPDSTRLAFVSDRDAPMNSEYYVVDVRTGDITRLTTGGAAVGDQFGSNIAWSPDGTQLAYVGHADDGYQLHLANADGSDSRVLIDNLDIQGNLFGNSVAWTGDANRIAFIGGFGPFTELYTYHLQSGEIAQISHDVPVAGISWRP